jgi:hypothetical protein
MWTRPDAFILAGALIAPQLVFRERTDGSRQIPWGALLRGGLLGGLFYLPWFAWSWWYYGSPVPHTIIAKAAVTAPVHVSALLLVPWRTLLGQSLLVDLFMPTYWFHGGWPQLLPWFAHVLTVIAAFAWLVPGLPAVARRVSLSVFLGMFYVCMIILFPWYSPPWTVLAALALAFTFDHFSARAVAANRRWIASALRVVIAVIVGLGNARPTALDRTQCPPADR